MPPPNQVIKINQRRPIRRSAIQKKTGAEKNGVILTQKVESIGGTTIGEYNRVKLTRY